MSLIKKTLLALLLVLPCLSYAQETFTLAYQQPYSTGHYTYNSSDALPVPPYHKNRRGGSGNVGRNLRIIGVTAAGTGLALAVLDFFVIETPGLWLGNTGSVLAVTGGPLFTVGSIVRHYEKYGVIDHDGMPAYASVKKEIYLGATRGRVGLFIDL